MKTKVLQTVNPLAT